jgi:ferritin-like metal-binding protein YciE
MAVQTTQEKFVIEIGGIYDAETQFLKGMEQMVQQASDPTLQSLIKDNIDQTQQQIRNLDEVYSLMGTQPQRQKSDAAAGLVAEAQRIVREAGTPTIRDCLIGDVAAKNEHFELASYRTLVTNAEALGQQQVVPLLRQNLQQVEQTTQRIEQTAPKLLKKALQEERR